MKKTIIEAHRNWFTTVCGYLILGKQVYCYMFLGLPIVQEYVLVGCALIGAKDSYINPFDNKIN